MIHLCVHEMDPCVYIIRRSVCSVITRHSIEVAYERMDGYVGDAHACVFIIHILK